MVAVTVTDADAADWFCTSVLTDTLADVALMAGVATKTPLFGTWMGETFVNQTLR
jgi:hypothetical protein